MILSDFMNLSVGQKITVLNNWSKKECRYLEIEHAHSDNEKLLKIEKDFIRARYGLCYVDAIIARANVLEFVLAE